MESPETRHADEWRWKMTAAIITLSILTIVLCSISFLAGSRFCHRALEIALATIDNLQAENARLLERLELSVEARYKEQFNAKDA